MKKILFLLTLGALLIPPPILAQHTDNKYNKHYPPGWKNSFEKHLEQWVRQTCPEYKYDTAFWQCFMQRDRQEWYMKQGWRKWGLLGNCGVQPYHFIGTIDAQNFNIKTDDSLRMVVGADGNVDILQKLYVGQTLGSGSLSGSSTSLVIAGQDGILTRLPLSSDSTFGSFFDEDWKVQGDNMYSMNSGNVGIGTNTAATKLDVNGTITSYGLRLRNLIDQNVKDQIMIGSDSTGTLIKTSVMSS